MVRGVHWQSRMVSGVPSRSRTVPSPPPSREQVTSYTSNKKASISWQCGWISWPDLPIPSSSFQPNGINKWGVLYIISAHLSICPTGPHQPWQADQLVRRSPAELRGQTVQTLLSWIKFFCYEFDTWFPCLSRVVRAGGVHSSPETRSPETTLQINKREALIDSVCPWLTLLYWLQHLTETGIVREFSLYNIYFAEWQ